jgi:hypothetical protein
MISAFGVDHGGISKADDTPTKRNRRGSALVGAGAVTAGTGLAAGGVPGGKSDFTSVLSPKPGKGKGPRKYASLAWRNKNMARAAPGGILGFRHHAHAGGTVGFEQKAAQHAKTGARTPEQHFSHARNAAKIAPEYKVMHGMMAGKKAANALLVGGVGAVGYGLAERRKHSVSKGRRESDTYNAGLVGAAGTGAVVSTGGSKFLNRKGNKYERAAGAKMDQAHRLAPQIGGRKTVNWPEHKQLRFMHKNPGKPLPKTLEPEVSDYDIVRHKKLQGVPHETARKVGALRGAAVQEAHFAHVLHNTARVTGKFRTPTAVAAAVGAGGLAASAHRKKS